MPNPSDPPPGLLRDYRFWQTLLVLYWLALAAATHVPKQFPGLPSGNADKVIHFSAFALLALLIAQTWQLAAGRLRFTHLAVAWTVLAVYAALDEWSQLAVGRDASALDWLADLTGATTGLTLFASLRKPPHR